MKNTLRPILPTLLLLLLFSGFSACSGPEEQNQSTDTEIDAGSDADTAPEPDVDEPGCQDGVLNGLETDVDCGGPECDACEIGAICDDNTDCMSGLCSLEGVCLAAPTCEDEILNYQETDVDCGGPNCPSCPDGDRCHIDTDCENGYCSSEGFCDTPTCDDLVQNSEETDVDCGGPECPPCLIGESCLASSDCENGICDDNTCVPIPISWSTVSSNYAEYSTHTCATRTDGTLWCWGNNNQGQLGIGSTNSRHNPTRVGTDDDWSSVSAGYWNTCAIRTDGSIWCWGTDWGAPTGGEWPPPSNLSPTRVGTQNNWTSISAGAVHNCATDNSNALWCWGRNNDGQIQLNGSGQYPSPYQLGDFGHAPIDINGNHSCGIDNASNFYCSGSNSHGQLGNGEEGQFNSDTHLDETGAWQTLSAGIENTCAIQINGSLWCWGRAENGITGPGSTNQTTPIQLGDSTLDWEKISVNRNHACAIRSDASLWCWGRNEIGEVSFNDIDGSNITAPRKYGSDTWETISVGFRYTCAINTDGELWCWGLNSNGQLGDGTTTDRSDPVQVTVP